MLQALGEGAAIVGYVDADLSTPIREIRRLANTLSAAPQLQVVLGARILRLGATIERHAARHYLGRVFASFASLALSHPVYDTQCGAKFFRSSASLNDALQQPFASRWAFDVELLGRLSLGSALAPPLPKDTFLEVPLEEWHDVGGSKLRPGAMLKAGVQLINIRRSLARRQKMIDGRSSGKN